MKQGYLVLLTGRGQVSHGITIYRKGQFPLLFGTIYLGVSRRVDDKIRPVGRECFAYLKRIGNVELLPGQGDEPVLAVGIGELMPHLPTGTSNQD
jgi:hypothetical protein